MPQPETCCAGAALESIQWQLKITDAIVFGRWKLASANVYLNRRQEQFRHGKRRVTLCAKSDKLILCHAHVNVDVFISLLGNRRFPGIFVPIWCFVVVTYE